MLQVAIFLISAAALAYEILLMRLLSVIHWQHFAAMIISVALLGYGASGTFVALFREFLIRRFNSSFALSAALFGVSSIGSFLVAQRLPFNPLELPWNPRQTLLVAALYLLFVVPFFFAATCIVLAFDKAGGNIARLYRADLAGAGAGALSVLVLLSIFSGAVVLKLISAAALLGGAAVLSRRLWAAALIGSAVLINLTPADWFTLRISQFKPLAQALRIPGAHVVEERSSPLGLVSVVESPEVPLRFAPGLSLNFFGELPDQVGLFVDAASMTVINRNDPSRTEYLDYLVSSLPYSVRKPSRVLVVAAGGGTDVLNALRHRTRSIDALELHPSVVDVVMKRYDQYSGGIYARPEVKVSSRQMREIVSTGEDYDLIVDSSGAASGLPSLSENYFFTIEGFTAALRRLSPAGMLSITRQVNMPPRDFLKLIATAERALARVGTPQPARHLILVRGWNAGTLLVSRNPFTRGEVAAVKAFSAARSFDVAFYAGMKRSEANQYNVLDEPFFFDGANALTSAAAANFIANYKFDISPSSDDRPFFGHFFRWKSLPELLRIRTRGGAPLLDLGYLVLVATLIQAAIAAFLIILLPIIVRARSQLRAGAAGRIAICFAALGLAFLFIEIVFIQKLTLLFGHPLAAIATALGAFLVFAGIGSGISNRISSMHGPVIAIAILILIYGFAWEAILRFALPLPQLWKVFGAIAVIAPLAIAMGVPFPLAMRAAGARNAAFVPWAWSINGCASVMSPVSATVLAIHFGFGLVAVFSVVLYGVAAFAFSRLTSS